MLFNVSGGVKMPCFAIFAIKQIPINTYNIKNQKQENYGI